MWELLADINLTTDDWEYSPTTSDTLFRFTPEILASSRIRIAQATDTIDKFTFFERTTDFSENKIIRLPFFAELGSRVLAFKRIDTDIRFDVEVFIPTKVASRTITASAVSQVFFDNSSSRNGGTIWNNSNGNLFIDFAETASINDFAATIAPNGYFELPVGCSGIISGIFDAGSTGSAFVRKF